MRKKLEVIPKGVGTNRTSRLGHKAKDRDKMETADKNLETYRQKDQSPLAPRISYFYY